MIADRVVTVSEDGLSRALLFALERAKQLVEPAGAAGVAALLEHPHEFEPPVVVVLSGGNIDPMLLAKVLRHGLSAAGRYLGFRCRLPDRPGALATLLGELAGLGANVLGIVHERVAPQLHGGPSCRLRPVWTPARRGAASGSICKPGRVVRRAVGAARRLTLNRRIPPSGHQPRP